MSKHLAAPPKEQLAIFRRPPSNPDRAILKPWPFYPIIFDAGTLQFSKITNLVG
jgi:hypothetical protein